MNLELVKTQLATESTLKLVEGAAELAAIESAPRQSPAAWVLPVSENASDNKLSMAVSQEITARFAIVIAVKNVRDARGDNAKADLETVREAIKAKLVGWQPAASYEQCIYDSGQLMQLSNGWLWWQDEFITRYELRAV